MRPSVEVLVIVRVVAPVLVHLPVDPLSVRTTSPEAYRKEGLGFQALTVGTAVNGMWGRGRCLEALVTWVDIPK